jgi:hypothetical protein
VSNRCRIRSAAQRIESLPFPRTAGLLLDTRVMPFKTRLSFSPRYSASLALVRHGHRAVPDPRFTIAQEIFSRKQESRG